MQLIGLDNMLKNQVQKGLLFGNSGGKDSATVIAMAVKALGCDKVLSVMAPCNSNSSDMEDAISVAEKFNVKYITVNLSNTFETLKSEVDKRLENQNLSKEAIVNIKPRLRMTTFYRNCSNFRLFSYRNW